MDKRPALGKGLSALIPDAVELLAAPRSTFEVDIDQLEPNQYQPRGHMDEARLEDLARSIKYNGVIQPIVVRRVENGGAARDRYQIIAGERRWRAAQRAQLARVPVVIKDVPEQRRQLEIALIENIQREDLNPIEEANAYHQLHDEFGLTQEEISRRVGKERSTVANFLRLLKLPETVRQRLASGQLSMGHARALLSLDSAKKPEALADRIVRNSLNVRQTEVLASAEPAKKREKPKDVFTRDAAETHTRTQRTKVEIDRKRRGGTIHIRFTSEDDLIRIFEDLTGRRR